MKNKIDGLLANLQGYYLFTYKFFVGGVRIETFIVNTQWNPIGMDTQRIYGTRVATYHYKDYNGIEELFKDIKEVIVNDQH